MDLASLAIIPLRQLPYFRRLEPLAVRHSDPHVVEQPFVSKLAASLARSGVSDFLLLDTDVFLPGNVVRNELDLRAVAVNKTKAVSVPHCSSAMLMLDKQT